MPQQGRLGDKSMVPADSHGCPACPHPCIGPAVAGSPDVLVNDMAALRVGDPGVHAACCGPNTWTAVAGAPGVFINDKKAHRLGDKDAHCGGDGKLVEGSPNVITGDYGSSTSVQRKPEITTFLQVQLKTSTGIPLADEEVEFIHYGLAGKRFRATTDGAGIARVDGVPPGRFAVVVQDANEVTVG